MNKLSLDNLEWLHDWYRRQCNGTWEHTHGLHLSPIHRAETGSNSSQGERVGWRLCIELPRTTATARRQPCTFETGSIDSRWMRCSITSQRFMGESDADSLEQIIGAFRRWIEVAPAPTAPRLEPELALRP